MVTIKRDVFLSEAGPSTTLPIRSRDEGNERQTIVQREEQSRAFRQSIITNVNMPSVLPVLQLSKMEMDAGSQRLSPVSNSPEPYNACTPPVFGNAQGGDIPINTQSDHALQDYQMQYMLLAQQNKRRLLLARQEQESLDQEQAASAQFVADDDFKLTPEEKAHILRRRKQQSEGPMSAKPSFAHKNPGKLALDDYEWVCTS